MRKLMTFLMTLVVGSCVSYAQADFSYLDFEAGYRHDDVKWTGRVPEHNPIYKTSTKFSDVDIFQIGLNGKTGLGCNFYVRGSAHWGWILDGNFKQTDTFFFDVSDFSGNQGFEFATSDENSIDDNWVFDFDIAIGYPFYFCDCQMSLAPVIGYSFDEQNFEVDCVDGFNFFDSESTDNSCCSSKSIFKWYGPFVGLDFNYTPCNSCWNFYADFEFFFGRMQAKRHFESDFDLFGQFNRKSRDAHGYVFKIGGEYEFCNSWLASLDFSYSDFFAHRRHHFDSSALENADFGSEACCDNAFKSNTTWRSWSISANAGRRF